MELSQTVQKQTKKHSLGDCECKCATVSNTHEFTLHEFHETCHSVTFYFMKKDNAVTPQCQSQFTPKMKANAVPRLLSFLL